jgi:hypothetical protein
VRTRRCAFGTWPRGRRCRSWRVTLTTSRRCRSHWYEFVERGRGSCGRGGRGRCGTCVGVLVCRCVGDRWRGVGVVRPRPAAACVCVVCMVACAFVCCWCGLGWLLVWVLVVVTQLACVCDARGLVGGLCVRLCRRRRACTACGASVVCVVARAGCSVWLGRGCGGSSGEVGLDCVFVCFTRGVRCAGGGVCAGAGSVWLWWVGAEVRGRVVGVAVVLSSAVRALRWFDASLTYLGVFAGRQVGGVRQLRQDGARLGRGHGEGGAEAGGSL